MRISFVLIGKKRTHDVDPARRLLDYLREDLHLTGTKEGCGEGECGACTVILNGRAVHACLTLPGQLDGSELLTIEGLEAEDGSLSPLQQSFADHGAIQCGFCTPGMVMSAQALLMENPHPDEAEIRNAIAGNICRCTGYREVIRAIQAVSGPEDG